ncbi:MAG TPA: hypothetical protein PKN56_08285 [Leptospiraceae bacterium]|nr:hypothetical protein [Leptospiraceae bacterium]
MKFVFIFFLTFFSSLLPDTVSFKSGKIDENVKARMQKRTILIQYEDGRSAEVSKKEIKQVKFSSVVWNTKIPENLDMDEKKKFMEKLAVLVLYNTGPSACWSVKPDLAHNTNTHAKSRLFSPTVAIADQ